MLKKHLTLLRLQVKAAFMALPKIMAGMVVFAVLMGIAAFAMVTVSKNKDDVDLLKVAVVYPEDNGSEQDRENEYIRQAFDMLEKMDTVKAVCQFVQFHEEEEAIELLKEQEVAAVVVLPERFISSIIYGENTPARIIYAKNSINNTSSMFREMIRAGAADLSSAQARIYSVDDVCRELLEDGNALLEAQTYLNLKYFAYALDRNVYYEEVDITDMNGFTAVQFYVVTGVLLMFLVSGITCVQLLKSESQVLGVAMKRYGVAPGIHHIYKVLGVTFVFWIIAGVAYMLMALSVTRFPQVANVITAVGNIKDTAAETIVVQIKRDAFMNLFAGVCGLFVLLMAVFSLAGFVFKLAGKTVSGVILLFLLSVAMMFASGCFLPSSMLPPVVAGIGEMLPTAWMFKLCGQIITGSVNILVVAVNAAFAGAFLTVSAIMENKI